MNEFTKRLLSFATAAVMVFSMIPNVGFAADNDQGAEPQAQSETSAYEGTLNLVDGMAVCPVCKGDAVEWTPLTAGQGLKKGVHYYLANSIEDTDTAAGALFPSAWTSEVDNNAGTICLHLNGYDVTTSGKYAFAMNTYGGTMNIMGTGTVSSTNWYGAVYLTNANAIFNIYGGTFVKGDATGNQPVIRVHTAGASVNMYGGKIGTKGNTMQHGTTAAVYLNTGGKFFLHDGTIYGGTGDSAGSVIVKSEATLTVNGGKITGGKTSTTNLDVLVESGGTLTNNTYVDAIDSVSFADSSYSYSAKCRYCDASKTWTFMTVALAGNCATDTHYLTTKDIENQYSAMDVDGTKTVCWALNGKTIRTGRSVRAQKGDNSLGVLNIMGSGEIVGYDGSSASSYAKGAVYAYWGGTLNLYGGTYSTENAQPALFISGASCVVNAYEGTVFNNIGGNASAVINSASDIPLLLDGIDANGTVSLSVASTKLTLSGKTAIDELSLLTGSTVDVSGLTEGAAIKVTAPDGVFTKALGTSAAAETAAGYFSVYNSTTKGVYANSDNKLEIGAKRGGYNDNLIFAEDGTTAWCPACQSYETWTELTGTSSTQNTAAGHYYLSGDYTNSYADGASLTVQAGASCLHLGEYTFKATGNIAINASKDLNIMGTGTITTSKDSSWQGTLYVTGGITTIWGDITFTKESTAVRTALLFAYDTGVIDIEGDAKIGTEGLTYTAANMAAIALRGVGSNKPTVNMKNGTVLGGENTAGTYGSAVVFRDVAGTFNMTGGELKAGTNAAEDALIYFGIAGTAEIGADATLTGAKAMLAYSSAVPTVTIAGDVEGSVDLRGGGTITLAGTPAIGSLILPANANITATGMTGLKDGSDPIVLNTTGTVGTFTDATAAKEWFTLDSSLSDYTLSVDGSTLKIAEAQGAETSITENLDFVGTKAWCPVCKTHGNVWTAVTNGMEISAAGHYYLNSEDITNITVSAASGTVCLHLNGHNITNASGAAITVSGKATLNIMGSGTVTGYSAATSAGAAVNVTAAGILNIHSGDYTQTDTDAPVIRIVGGTMNIKGGTLTSKAAYATLYTTTGTINISGGTVTNATTGGKAVNMWSSAAGGSITGGTITGYLEWQGANLTVSGKPVIDGEINNSGTKSTIDVTGLEAGADVTFNSTFGTSSAFGSDDAAKEKAETVATLMKLTGTAHEFAVESTDGGYVITVREKKGEEREVYETLDLVNGNAYCPVCGGYVDWEETSGGTISGGGHYYLSADITTAITVSATDKVCLHLNGFSVTSTTASTAAITVSGACSGLHIMGTADSTVSGTAGGWSGSALNVTANATVHMYAGTYTKNAADVAGPIVELTGAGGTVYMYAPAVIDARNLSASNLSPALAIRGAQATPGKFVMEGGTIYGGTQTSDGPRKSAAVTVYDSYSTFQMKGGDLYAGTVTNDNLNADAISFQSGGTLIIEDGATVHAGTGYSIVIDITTDVSIAGTVAGTVYITNNGKNANVKLSNAAKVGKLIIPAGMLIEVSDLGEGADVKVDAVGTFTNAITTDAAAIVNNGWISSAYPTYDEVAADVATLKINYIGSTDATDTLTFYNGINKAYCPGCGKLACWAALSKTTGCTYLQDGDHYYVPTGGFAYTGTGRAIGITTAGRVGCLHMNGENITTTDNVGGILVSGAGTVLNIMGKGTITGNATATWAGAALQVQTESDCNLYGNVTLTKTDSVAPVVLLLTGGHLTMNDEVVIGATGLTYGAAAAVSIRAINGDVNIGSTLTMNGGTVYGGNASNGASAIFFVDAASGDLNALDMQGGKLVGDPNSTDDSTIYAAGAFNLYIGKDAVVGATGAGKAFDSAWVSNDTQMTIAGTVNGSMELTDLDHGMTGPKLVGNVKINEIVLDGTNKVDATQMTENAKVYINFVSEKDGKNPHETYIFTSENTAEHAQNLVKWGCILPIIGVQKLEITGTNALKVVWDYAADLDFLDDAKTQAYCPACQKLVTDWKAVDATTRNYFADGYHYYIPEGGITGTTNSTSSPWVMQMSNAAISGCLHMNGNNLSTTPYNATPVTAIRVSAASTLNIMGTGTISGSGVDKEQPAALWVAATDAKVNIYGNVTLTKDSANKVSPIVLMQNGGTVSIRVSDPANVVIDGRNQTVDTYAVVALKSSGTAFNMYGGTYYASAVTNSVNGENAIYMATGSSFNMQDGTMYAGTAATAGKSNILVSGNNVTIGEDAEIHSDSGYVINQWDGTGTLTISGHIEGKVQTSQTKSGQFVLSGTPEITTLHMANASSIAKVDGMTGGEIGLSISSNTLRVFTSEITTGDPATLAGYFTYVGETEENLVILADGNYLTLAKAAFEVIGADGSVVEINTVAEAVEYVSTTPGSYIKITDTTGLTLNGESITVDMNGNNATFSGTGTITGFDSTTDNFGVVNAGQATVAADITVNQDETVNDNRYLYIIENNGAYSFHRVVIKLTNIVLNTQKSALYYKAAFQTDAALANRVEDFGISYSLVEKDGEGNITAGGMPNINEPLSSQIDVSMMGAAGGFTGNNDAKTSYIYGIVTEGKDNTAAVETQICANPYIFVDVTGDADVEGFGQYAPEATSSKSMKDILNYYDNEARYEALKNQNVKDENGEVLHTKAQELDAFCEKMNLTGFTYIGTATAALEPAATNDEEEEA